MSDLLDALENQAHLTDALEERFGRAPDWPLRVTAAWSQLRGLRDLMTDADYAALLHCAIQALARTRTPDDGVPRPYRVCLARALTAAYGQAVPEALDVARHTVLGLHGLLGEEDFTHLMRGAGRAWIASVSAPVPVRVPAQATAPEAAGPQPGGSPGDVLGAGGAGTEHEPAWQHAPARAHEVPAEDAVRT